jgi:hypothetical protein
MITLDSCHSRWVFDTDRMRFRRVLRGPDLELRTVTTEWRPYFELHIEENSDSFVVTLNADGTRMLRSWRHLDGNCPNCGMTTGEVAQVSAAPEAQVTRSSCR